MTDTWRCHAYFGKDDDPDELPSELRDLCFFQEIERCTTEPQCLSRMESERQRVFRRINELAAAGNPTGEFLEGEFTSPDQLLNADRGPGEDNGLDPEVESP